MSAELRAQGLRPRKQLGQNFLQDTSFLPRILDAAEIASTDDVLEIGAGTGILTRALLERAGQVVAIELDDSLFALLQSQLADRPNLELWHGNALDFEPGSFFADRYKLLGNIPYYITGPLIRRFLETPVPPAVMVFMVQLEVAERIVAQPGKLSVLGVSVQYYAEARLLIRVPARAFFPIPNVDSALLRLVPKASPTGARPEAFFRVVKAGFSMPRKQIINSLAAGLRLERSDTHAVLHAASIDDTRRAETLSVSDWEMLTTVVQASPARLEA